MADDADSLDDWLLKGAEDPREVAARYDAWARRYDADLGSWSYQAPAVVARTVVARRPDATAVLDVGCGTGLVGQALRAEGYAGASPASTSPRSHWRSRARPGRTPRWSRPTSSSRSRWGTAALTRWCAWG